MTEIEIKLSCAERERLLAAFQDDLIRKAAVSAPKKMRMHSEYYDTPDAALYAAGLSLRFRTENGKGYITLKTAPACPAAADKSGISESAAVQAPSDGLAVRGEYEFPAASLADGLPQVLAAAPQYAAVLRTAVPLLRQTASVTYERTDQEVRFGETAAVFSFDRGYCNGCAEDTFFELEAELKRGDAVVLRDVCHSLSQKYGLTPVTVSKLRRALDKRRKREGP